MMFKSFLMSMRRNLIVVIAAAVLLASAPTLFAQDAEETCEGLVILQTWARPALEGTNSAVYGIIVNLGNDDEILTAATSSAAGALELHESSMTEDGVMEMRPLDDGVLIPAQGMALLEPGSMHIMAINLSDTLETDTTIDLQLNFMNAGDVDLEVSVGEPEEPVLQAFHVEHCDTIGLWGAWARPTALENSNSALYGILLNLGDEDDMLIDVVTDTATEAELHETKMLDDGTMQMTMLEDGVELPARSFVLLEPGGTHIMLIGVQEPLLEGEEIKIELQFQTEEPLSILLPIVTQEHSMMVPSDREE